MTYIVSSGTLNPTIPYHTYGLWRNWAATASPICSKLLPVIYIFRSADSRKFYNSVVFVYMTGTDN